MHDALEFTGRKEKPPSEKGSSKRTSPLCHWRTATGARLSEPQQPQTLLHLPLNINAPLCHWIVTLAFLAFQYTAHSRRLRVQTEKTKPPAFGPAHFINRELSWLEFNQRVLDEALDANNPLLERLKFFCIVNSNLDEFFEVRVAGIKQQIESDIVDRSLDGLTATEIFKAITARVRRMVDDGYACWRQTLKPALAKNSIRILEIPVLDLPDVAWLLQYYRAQVRPVLTPLAIDPAHPFPQLL